MPSSPLFKVFLTSNHLVLAMEYAPGGDLFRYVSSKRSLGEDEARWFFQQLIVAVDYCHRMGVASRDIKLENTLLDTSPRRLIKLADFGFSKDEQQSAPTSRVGTPAYLAPEVIVSKPGTWYDGKKADIWSCGVLLYILVTGTYPFQRVRDSAMKGPQRLNAILNRILSVDYIFPERKQLSQECKDLISAILVASALETGVGVGCWKRRTAVVVVFLVVLCVCKVIGCILSAPTTPWNTARGPVCGSLDRKSVV